MISTMHGFFPRQSRANATPSLAPYRASSRSAGGPVRDRFRIEGEGDARALLGSGHESEEYIIVVYTPYFEVAILGSDAGKRCICENGVG